MLLIYKNIVYRKKGAIRIQIFLNKGGKKKRNFRSGSLRFGRCPKWDLNPHALMNTWPSTMPVYQFQHPGRCIFNGCKYNGLF